jgi:16S rRNA (guanine527-N7)-methyltransferase
VTLSEHIVGIASAAGLELTLADAAPHAQYLALLARWNRKTNLTSLHVDPPDDAAIRRLILEPLMAARFVRDVDRNAVDLGSGGGSPALPLKLARPRLGFTLVESRARKCAFLREAVRHLGLQDVQIAETRFEMFTPTFPPSAADLVTFRAVRADGQLWDCVNSMLSPDGQVAWFGHGDGHPDEKFRVVSESVEIAILRRA